jgi:hypothetical protein
MATKFSTVVGNLLRGDIDSRDELRAAAHLLMSLLARDIDDGATYVLDCEKNDETGGLVNLGVYTYDDFIDLMDEDDDEEEGE